MEKLEAATAALATQDARFAALNTQLEEATAAVTALTEEKTALSKEAEDQRTRANKFRDALRTNNQKQKDAEEAKAAKESELASTKLTHAAVVAKLEADLKAARETAAKASLAARAPAPTPAAAAVDDQALKAAQAEVQRLTAEVRLLVIVCGCPLAERSFTQRFPL